jgi:hypothetical protein
VILHRTSALPAEDVHRMPVPPRTLPARSVVDAAQWAGSDDEACAVVAAAFQRGLVTAEEIHHVLDRLPRARRRPVIAAAADDAAGGRRRYLDVYYEPWGVHVEIDGAQHNDPRQQWADMKRQNEIWTKGDRVLRFPAFLVRNRPDEVFTQVRAALEAAGWRPDGQRVRRTS